MVQGAVIATFIGRRDFGHFVLFHYLFVLIIVYLLFFPLSLVFCYVFDWCVRVPGFRLGTPGEEGVPEE
jgi:hypothetical protein